MDAAGLYDTLAGGWRFQRHASTGERMQGEALFQPLAPDSLRYREEGRAILPDGRELSFFRNYLYRIEGAVMTILFDGPTQGLFQRVTLSWADGAWVGQGHHPCGQDIYRSDYRIAPGSQPGSQPGLTIRHRVTGPKKDYLLDTAYRRDDSPAP